MCGTLRGVVSEWCPAESKCACLGLYKQAPNFTPEGGKLSHNNMSFEGPPRVNNATVCLCINELLDLICKCGKDSECSQRVCTGERVSVQDKVGTKQPPHPCSEYPTQV